MEEAVLSDILVVQCLFCVSISVIIVLTSILVLCLFSPDSAVSPPRTTSSVELSFSRGHTFSDDDFHDDVHDNPNDDDDHYDDYDDDDVKGCYYLLLGADNGFLSIAVTGSHPWKLLPSSRLHKSTNAKMHKFINAQMHKCTNAQMHK